MSQDSLKKLQKLVGLGKADLHMHLGEAGKSVHQLLEHVQNNTDLDVIALTDHDRIDLAQEAQKMAKRGKYRFEVIVGEEVTSRDGHILGLFLKKAIPAGMSAHKTIREIKQQGGLAIASHPFQYMRWQQPHVISMDGVGLKVLLEERKNWDGIEVINASPLMADENIRASIINRTVLLTAEIGSSDAHILPVIGKGYTLFKGRTAKDLAWAIKHQQTQAIHEKWTLRLLLRYAFFFLPEGVRLGIYTLRHGRRKKK